MLFRTIAPLALVAALAVAGCGGDDAPDAAPSAPAQTTGATPASTVKVVATTTQLGDIVREIGGSAAEVTQILQPNSDPHDYEPRPRDVQETTGAKLVVASGGHLDHWIDDVVEQSGDRPEVLEVEDHLTNLLPGEEEEEGHDDGDEHGADEHDPHWWHDPRNVETAIPLIRDALTKANPGAKAVYAANADAYAAKVRTLDAGIETCFQAVPAPQRKLVTDHDAFGYFARRYDVTVVGAVIPSQTTQAQPSAGSIARLRALIQREGVKAVFPETSVNKKLAEAIARATGATADHVLYGDTLGPAGSDGATYLTMERHNADAMIRGFTNGQRGCDIPGL